MFKKSFVRRESEGVVSRNLEKRFERNGGVHFWIRMGDFSTGTRYHRMFDWNRLQTWTRLWWREEEDAAPAAVVAAVVARGRANAFANRVEEGEGWSYPRILSSSSTWKCTSSRPGSAWRKWLAKPARCGAPCRRVRKGNTFSWRKRRGEEEDRDKRKVCLLVIPKLVIRTRGWNGSRERSFDSKAFSRTRSCEESDACSKTSGAFQSKCSRIFAQRRNNNNTNSYLSLKSKHKEIRIENPLFDTVVPCPVCIHS